jgi:putative hydrolase of the HAD superfamily
VTLQPITTLILDYGEVLCRPASRPGMSALAFAAGIPEERFLHLYWQFREDYDRGRLSAPAYWGQVGEAAGVALHGSRVAALIERDVENWIDLDPDMLAWVDGQIDAGVRVGLLSNMVREIGHRLRELGVFSRFAHVTYSCEIGVVKPEADAYRHALDGLAVAAHEALFIDDRQANVDAARALGLHAIRFRGYEALIQDLASYSLVGAPA